MTWNDAVKSRLMAYCRIDALEEGEELLLQGLYEAAVSYMEQAGVSEPEGETPRRAQYDLCVNYLVLDGYDRRDVTITGTIVSAILPCCTRASRCSLRRRPGGKTARQPKVSP